MGKQPEDEIRDWMSLTGCEGLSVLFDTGTWYWRCWLHPQTEGQAETAKDCAGWKYR
jgi:hypothetical protein